MLREIKKKTAVYGILAVLLATTLGAVCLNFGIRPSWPPISVSALSTFSPYEELENYLMTNQKTPSYDLAISDKKIKMNNLKNLTEINKIELP